MGNTRSAETVHEEDIWWTNGENPRQPVTSTEHKEELIKSDPKTAVCEGIKITEREQRRKELEEDFIKFKQELGRKHDIRRELIAEKKKEMMNLRDELLKEKEENQKLKRLLEKKQSLQDSNENGNNAVPKEFAGTNPIINNLKEENEDLRNELEKLRLTLTEKEMLSDKNKELRISLAEMQKELQGANTEIIGFEKERLDYQEHVTALKDIIRVTKEMLRVRESQIEELKKKITNIEELLASKEISILSDDLRQEYERQLRNIRDLRALYDERQRADKRDKENLQSQIDDLKKNVEDEETKNREFKERIDELEADNSKKYDKILSLESNYGLSKAECRELHAEMEIINQLFSQILISFNNEQDIDLDKMIKTLEENHDLLTNIVINDESGETSALPKVLLELVNQVNENKKDNKDISQDVEEAALPQSEKNDKLDTIKEEDEGQVPGIHQLNSPEDIVENLPKVWKVLIELLSHQCPPNNEITEKKGENDNHCYKSVDTPTGSRKVLSVSKTFIRLKSLILEKKSLEKEMTRLKSLNTHLEGRLSDQEKRLLLVSNELSKTWNFVGKMQKQHQQLHTQEKILRYELAQKRKLLTELKEELEYCRQKWAQAREQNSSTEKQWKQLRTEFASRKRIINDDINNSVESGYSDDKSSSDEDDRGFNKKSQDQEHVEGKLNQNKENETQSSREETKSSEHDVPVSNTDEVTEELNNVSRIEDAIVLDPEMAEIEKLCLDVGTSGLSEAESSSLDVLHSLELQKTDVDDKCELKRQVGSSHVLTEANSHEENKISGESLVVSETQQNINKDDDVNELGNIKTTDDGLASSQCVDVLTETNTHEEKKNSEDGEVSETEQNICRADDINESKNAETIGDGLASFQCVPDLTETNTHEENKISEEGLVVSETDQNICKNDDVSKSENIKTTDDGLASFQCTDNANFEKPSTSTKNPTQVVEEFVARREERMKRLEEQCNQLFCSVAKTSLRGMVISHKLDNLHEIYGDNSESISDRQAVSTDNTEIEEDNQTAEEKNIQTNEEEEKEEEYVRPNIDSTNESNQE